MLCEIRWAWLSVAAGGVNQISFQGELVIYFSQFRKFFGICRKPKTCHCDLYERTGVYKNTIAAKLLQNFRQPRTPERPGASGCYGNKFAICIILLLRALIIYLCLSLCNLCARRRLKCLRQMSLFIVLNKSIFLQNCPIF